MEYRHTQWGYVALPLLVFFVVILGATLMAGSGQEPAVVVGVVAMMALIEGVVLLFSRLTVVVSSNRAIASFGLGWPSRKIDLTEVTGLRAVRNRWFYGWGIRKVQRGWMYNVWGLDAVELEFASGRVFRIGTDESDVLLTHLSLATGRTSRA